MLVSAATNLALFPAFDGFGVEVSVIESCAGFTVCIRTDDALFPFEASPLYRAVMLFGPAGSLAVLIVAVPVPSRVPFPRLAVPFLNVTVPVGVTPPELLTTAVNVTVWPKIDGFGAEPSATLVVKGLTISVTVLELGL